MWEFCLQYQERRLGNGRIGRRQGALRTFVVNAFSNWAYSSQCGALSEFLVVDRKRLTRSPTSSSLSLEQFAILAVSGFAAHRAVSTVPRQIHGCRVLVLQAHDGVGALVCQELVAGKAKVTAQIPDTPGTLEMAKLLKVSSIKIGEPLQVIESLEEGSFDLVVDTIGGRDIWQACRRLFTQDGQV